MVALGTSTYCQLKDFLPSMRKGLLQHTVDYEVSALESSRLAFCENSSTGKESVRCTHKRVSVLSELNLVKM